MSKKNKRRMQAQQQQTIKPLDEPVGGVTLTKTNEIPGVFSCKFVHKTKETTADFRWDGDTLNAVWPQVLAFFRWTQQTYHSESQVRLFVNNQTGEWKAWAFPQKAKLGMSAKEITEGEEGYDKAQEQRAQFNDDWEYWGTVHHHCNCSAFQSGTDEANERNQEGIHITVGNLDRLIYDIHFRLYVGGFKLKDVTALDFWDIGDELLSVPEKFRFMLPANVEEQICKWQMGTPPPADTEFPEVWKENIIDITPKAVVTRPSQTYSAEATLFGGHAHYIGRIYLSRAIPSNEYDMRRAAHRMEDYIKKKESQLCTNWEDVIGLLLEIDHVLGGDAMNLMAMCTDCDVMPADMASFLVKELHGEELKEELKQNQIMDSESPRTSQPQQQQKPQGLISNGGPQNPHAPNKPHWSEHDFSGY